MRALPLLTERMQALLPAAPQPWRDLVTHQISQHCAAFFDAGQARWGLDRRAGLFATWRARSPPTAACPGTSHSATRPRASRPCPAIRSRSSPQALDALRCARERPQAYLSALLLSINGWAAWCAYERWQARLGGGDDDQIVHLLAIRLAWELLLHDDAAAAGAPALSGDGWAQQWATPTPRSPASTPSSSVDWLLQDALEIAYQQPLCSGLLAALQQPAIAAPKPAVQAVFCIDVRSEVFRRALESARPASPPAASPASSVCPSPTARWAARMTRPQLPGLLAPAITVSESVTDEKGLGQALTERRQGALAWRQRWADLRAAAASAFSFVETCGLVYGAKLLKDSLPSEGPPARWEDTGLSAAESSPPPAPAAGQHRPGRRREPGGRHPQRHGPHEGLRAAGDAGRPRQPDRQQPACRRPGLRRLRRPDRRGQRPRAGRPAQHAGGSRRAGQAGPGHSRGHALPARAAQHHHRRGAAVRHRRRAARPADRAGRAAKPRCKTLASAPAPNAHPRSAWRTWSTTHPRWSVRCANAPTTGRRCGPSGAWPTTPPSSWHRARAPRA